MSAKSDEVKKKVDEVLKTAWSKRDGRVVPKSEDIALSGGAVNLSATYLYADLADSSGAAHKLKKEVTGKIIRCYLDSSTRIIRHYGGAIRSFDGDRVMGIFVGDDSATNGLRAALAINWAMQKVVKPKLLEQWETLEELWTPSHGVGVDHGEAMLIRGGIRDNNDIVSIGSAPNVAAKLSGLRRGPNLHATQRCYAAADDSVKITSAKKNLWAVAKNTEVGGAAYELVSSTWFWAP